MKRTDCQLLDFEELKRLVDDSRLIVYPTDTIYALGVNPHDAEAVKRLYAAKKRDKGMPVSIAFSSVKETEEMVEINELARSIMNKHLPGKLTIILPVKDNADLARGLASSEGRIGIRVPDNPCALSILKAAGPLTATSANIHGGDNPDTIDKAIAQLGDSVSLFIDGGPCDSIRPSTVIDVYEDGIKVIREGAVSVQSLEGINE